MRAEQQALVTFPVLVGTHVPRPTASPVEYCRTPPDAGDTREVEDDRAEEIRRYTAITEFGSRSHLPQRFVAIGVEIVERQAWRWCLHAGNNSVVHPNIPYSSERNRLSVATSKTERRLTQHSARCERP